MESLRLYIERVLCCRRPPPAILTDIDFLPDSQRETIADLSRRNTEAVQTLLNAGTSEGRFRAVDHAIVAQCLVGMLNWAQLSAAWLGYHDTAKVRARAAASIIDILLNGLATNPANDFVCPIELSKLTARSFNAFDRAEATQEKASQVAIAAARLFNRKGLDGVSLDEIGASLGATKGAVYHYFDDKTDLVLRCYGMAFDLYERILDTASSLAISGLERSLTVMHLNSEAQAGEEPPLILQAGLFSLPDPPAPTLSNAHSGCGNFRTECCNRVLPMVAVATAITAWLPRSQRVPSCGFRNGSTRAAPAIRRELLDRFPISLPKEL